MLGEHYGATIPIGGPGRAHQVLQEPQRLAPCARFSRSLRQWRTPAHPPHPCTYQQPLAALIGHSWRLEHGAGCPVQGPLPARSLSRGTSTSVLQSTVRASWAEGRRHQERCHWWGGHIPTSGVPHPPGTGGLCQTSRSPLPARWVAGLLVEDAGPGDGWVGGGVSSCWLPVPAASLTPLAPTRTAAPRCFPRSS